MSGICGFYNEENKRLLDEMCEVLARGGPDDRATFSAGPVDLGITRLEKAPQIGCAEFIARGGNKKA